MSHLLEAAVLCEELGFHAVWVGDSVLAKPRYRPIPTLAAIAGRTKRIALGAGILQPHLYNNPVVLALEWATLDVVAGGRTILGVGIGAGERKEIAKETEACGVPKKSRGKVFEETIEVLKRLWTEGEVSFSGDFYRLNRVALGYKPAQKPHPPIWIAAGSDGEPADETRSGIVLERVARLGDGWFTLRCSPDQFARTYDRIREIAERNYGRAPDQIGSAMSFFINVNPNRQAALREAQWFLSQYNRRAMDLEEAERWCLLGPPEESIERIQAFTGRGLQALYFVIASRDQIGHIKTIAKHILPAFH